MWRPYGTMLRSRKSYYYHCYGNRVGRGLTPPQHRVTITLSTRYLHVIYTLCIYKPLAMYRAVPRVDVQSSRPAYIFRGFGILYANVRRTTQQPVRIKIGIKKEY